MRPEKDYLSFSLVYNNGARTLDLICKDQGETELWLAGLTALISTGQHRHSREQSDRISVSDDSDFVRPYGASIDISSSISCGRAHTLVGVYSTREPSLYSGRSDVGSDHANMQLRTSNVDGSRLSISSSPSCSSQGSGPDDIESLGDVFIWGEVWCDGILSGGRINWSCSRSDTLLPKPLESNVVLDVHQIACGFRHVGLVTRQGEVFTWGEESGGRLGHGVESNLSRPRLVDTVAVCNVDSVACGEYHTCAISAAGDLFTWGDGTHNSGLLGHKTVVSHWIPKRVSGPLEGIQVLSVSCGTWHSALTTSDGKVFTFGDGTFGVLGHGNRESIAYPKQIESLSGLRTVKVACGVWHTAAIVEVSGQAGVNVISRKLFTWGDGDKYRLGHGDKEARLVPTCVPSLIDYNFHQLACGDSMTVALTMSGHVLTWGSTIYGQLGNPRSDGKIPCLVQDRLSGELIEEICCGAYHVAVLTSRSEVYTWGKGSNGRLGHGDVEDRKSPTIVEALKDRHVKSISCGSNFTACICIHKWVSGADQSLCTGCRQAFGFTRKRHNCYHCGLVHCHACSSRKALKAALAPTPGKPHRVCDSCFAKLKAAESSIVPSASRVNVISRRYTHNTKRYDRGELRSSRLLLSPDTEPVKYVEVKPAKNEAKSDSLSLIRASQVPSLLQLKEMSFPSSLSAFHNAFKPMVTAAPPPPPPPSRASHTTFKPMGIPTPPSPPNSRPTSPYTRRPSPPPAFSSSIIDSLKKTNALLDNELLKLQVEVKSLKHKCELQDVALKKSEKKAEEAVYLASEKSAKCTSVVECIKSFEVQLKDMVEKLAPETSDNLNGLLDEAESFLKVNGHSKTELPAFLDISSSENDQLDLASGGAIDIRLAIHHARTESCFISPTSSTNHGSKVTEQFEPGVYVTLIQLVDGTKVFHQVRFSKRRFAEQQATDWWKENQERVYKKYPLPTSTSTVSVSVSAANTLQEDA